LRIILFFILFAYSSATLINNDMIAKLSNSNLNHFSFVVMGDNRDGNNILNKIILKTNQDSSIKFLINNGDFLPNGYQKEYKSYLQIIKNSEKPILSVIGNHEIPWYDGKTNYKKIFGNTDFSFTCGNSYFIVLDSSDKKISKKQFIWLEKELEISQQYLNRFVVSHVPLYDPREGKYQRGHSFKKLKQAKKLNNLFDKYNVTMFFGSHIHLYFKGMWHNTPYIITGGAGAPLKKNGFYHYIKVIVNGANIEYKVVKIDAKPLSLIEQGVQSIKDIFNLGDK